MNTRSASRWAALVALALASVGACVGGRTGADKAGPATSSTALGGQTLRTTAQSSDRGLR